MKSTNSLSALIAAGLLFAALTVNAQTATNRPPGGARAGGRGGPAGEAQLTRLTQMLKLTDDQKAKVKVVLEEQTKKMQELRTSGSPDRAKLQAVQDESSKKMKEILTADQFQRYQEVQQRRGERRAGNPGEGNRRGNARTNAPNARLNGQ